MPWARHHTLALHASAAMLLGPPASARSSMEANTPLVRGLTLGTFRVHSSFADTRSARSAETNITLQPKYHFRSQHRPRLFHAASFFQRVNAAFFADYGGAFYDLDPHD
jgi:hypothetical protein